MIRSSFFLRFLMLCSLFWYSCSKDKAPAALPPNDGKMSIDLGLVYPDPGRNVNSNEPFELIISTSSGEVLFDTVGTVNKQIIGRFYTKEKKLDVTTVFLSTYNSKYLVNTYRGVDITGWDTLMPYFGQQFLNVNNVTTRSEIQFVNIPNYNVNPYFSCSIGSSFVAIYPPAPSGLRIEYSRAPGVPIYLLFPEEGTYKIYVPQSGKDTVNLSVMEKAKRIPFDLTASQSINLVSFLYGITDTNDVSKSILLYNTTLRKRISELLYPVQPFQKYLFYLSGGTSANEFYGFSSFTDSIPKKYNLPTAANYNILSSLADNFSVSFTGEKPMVYTTKWSTDLVDWTIYSSADSTKYQPMSMMKKFKSSFLQNTNISSLALSQFSLEISKDFDYSGYMSKNMISRNRWNLRDYVTAQYIRSY